MASSMLGTLLSQIISDDTVKSLSSVSGAKGSQVEDLLSEAVPTLLSAMASNASSKKGALSLSSALDDHASTKSISSLIKSADLEDGAKILKKIFGADETKVEKKLSKSSGLDTDTVVQILCAIAPVILSLIGNTKKKTDTGAEAIGTLLSALLGSDSSSSKKDDDSTAELLGSVLSSLLK